MEFIIKDIEGSEHGPVDQDTLKKWIDEDRVNSDTPIRNSLLGKWKTVAELDFVEENLSRQAKRLEETSGQMQQNLASVSSIKSIFKKAKKEKTSFTYQHAPEAANTSSRIWAFVFDMGFLAVVLFLPLFAIASYYAYSYAVEATDNSVQVLPRQYVIALPEEKEAPAPDAVAEAKNVSAPPTAAQPKVKTVAVSPAADKQQVAGGVENPAAAAENPATPEIVKPVKKKPVLDNLNAESPPCTRACESAGYIQGALWNDIKDGKSYICLSGAENEARWIQTVKLKKIYTVTAVIALGLVMIYYGVALGYFAQTFGMWFWGIFITKNDISEVYLYRAFLFTVMMMTLGIAAPFVVYIFGRAPHDLICGVRVINVVGKTQI